MDIISLSFEEPLIISLNNQLIKLVPYKTLEFGNIKFGIEAPRSVNVHREEIFHAIKTKRQTDSE